MHWTIGHLYKKNIKLETYPEYGLLNQFQIVKKVTVGNKTIKLVEENYVKKKISMTYKDGKEFISKIQIHNYKRKRLFLDKFKIKNLKPSGEVQIKPL